ncbi:hypothetical protein [Hufsiella ginkgonis]|uniref:Uncharacterized protein n=1 Tax=Hufsiella ginkgonis TaxID=2695274 RepID=A0A7K1XSW7_9SPHI|nr:hypothetical protein [Hufsiella ginkgonis]MXV14010.1 hypothetical protein [Hufsiella ginkgonis]
MKTTYFKHRRRFDFKPHDFEVGNLLGVQPGYEDNHFLLKILKLPEDQLSQFYNYHLEHFLQQNPGMEREFFAHVWRIVKKRIEHFESKDPFSSSHSDYVKHIEKLSAFSNHLATLDQWKVHFPIESIVKEKNQEIDRLTEKIAGLEKKLEKLQLFDTIEKITIPDGSLPTAIDIFRQLQETTVTGSKKLFSSQTQSPWYKLLAKYFNHGEKEIPIDTARNYFPAQKKTKLIKGSDVQEADKLFLVVRKNT